MGNGIENVAKQAITEAPKESVTSIDTARQETFSNPAGFADLKVAEAAKFSGSEASLPNLILGATPPDETPESSGRPDGPTVEGVARDSVRAARDVSKVVRDGAELLRGVLDDIQDQMPAPDDEQGPESDQYPQDLPSGFPGGSSNDKGMEFPGGSSKDQGPDWPTEGGRSGSGAGHGGSAGPSIEHGGGAGASHGSSGRDRGWSVNDGRPTPTDVPSRKIQDNFPIRESSSNSGAIKPTESKTAGY